MPLRARAIAIKCHYWRDIFTDWGEPAPAGTCVRLALQFSPLQNVQIARERRPSAALTIAFADNKSSKLHNAQWKVKR